MADPYAVDDEQHPKSRHNDCCAQICALVLVTFSILACFFAYEAVISCEYIIITIENPQNNTSNYTLSPIFQGGGERALAPPSPQKPDVEEEIDILATEEVDAISESDSNRRHRRLLDITTEDLLIEEERELRISLLPDDKDVDDDSMFFNGTDSNKTMGESEKLYMSSVPTTTPVPTLTKPTLSFELTESFEPTPFPTSSQKPSHSFAPSESRLPTMSNAPTSWDDAHVAVSVGLFQYEVVDTETGDQETVCAKYNYNNDQNPRDLPLYLNIARVAIMLALGGSVLSAFIIGIEYIFCKLPGGRLLINIGTLVGMLAVPLTFIVFADTRCSLLSLQARSDKPSCAIGEGGKTALIAGIFLFITFLMACVAPKSRPIVRVIKDLENDGFFQCDGQGQFFRNICACLGACCGHFRQKCCRINAKTDIDTDHEDGDDGNRNMFNDEEEEEEDEEEDEEEEEEEEYKEEEEEEEEEEEYEEE